MLRDFTQVLCNLDGSEAKDQDGKAITLTSISIQGLLAVNPQQPTPAEQKAKRFQLASKINKDPKEVNITAEEMTMLKNVIGEFFGPLVVGRSYELLEQEPKLAEKTA